MEQPLVSSSSQNALSVLLASSVQAGLFSKTVLFTTTALLKPPTLCAVLQDTQARLPIWALFPLALFVLNIITAEMG